MTAAVIVVDGTRMAQIVATTLCKREERGYNRKVRVRVRMLRLTVRVRVRVRARVSVRVRVRMRVRVKW